MKELLLVNANVNRKSSRTQRLTKAFLRELAKREEFHTTELILESMHLAPLSSSSLNRRYALIDERLGAYGIDITKPGGVDKVWGDFGSSKTDDGTYERDLDTMAWTRNWVKFAHMIGKYPTREKPELPISG